MYHIVYDTFCSLTFAEATAVQPIGFFVRIPLPVRLHSCVCSHVQMAPVALLAMSIRPSRTIPVCTTILCLCRNGLGSSVYVLHCIRSESYIWVCDPLLHYVC